MVMQESDWIELTRNHLNLFRPSFTDDLPHRVTSNNLTFLATNSTDTNTIISRQECPLRTNALRDENEVEFSCRQAHFQFSPSQEAAGRDRQSQESKWLSNP